MPKEFHKFIKYHDTAKMWYIVFFRKDNRQDGCGYRNTSLTKIKRLALKDFKHFKKLPIHWSDLTSWDGNF